MRTSAPLNVSIEINGSQMTAGQIIGSNPDNAFFSYSDDYLNDKNAAPVSISLPLQEKSFSPKSTAVFFEGLLPEGYTRKSVAQWLQVDDNNYLSILAGLGNECLGAIRITQMDAEPPKPQYIKLNSKKICELAAEGVVESAQLVTESRLSLTGASGKVGLYYDSSKDEWYLPIGDAPGTHIVKQSHIRLNDIVINEQLSLRTAARLGIDVPESFIVNVGEGKDKDVLFATKRYDRDIFGDKLVSGMKCPLRRHQEDFAQALGISASSKYEPPGDKYLSRVAELIRRHCVNPVEDLLKLWDITVFNRLLGNTDNHIKNLSFLYSPDLKSVSLAPAYDLLSIVIYQGMSDAMAMNVGGVYRLYDIDRSAWERAAGDIGLGVNLLMERMDNIAERFAPALKESAEELTSEGFVQAEELEKKINSIGG